MVEIEKIFEVMKKFGYKLTKVEIRVDTKPIAYSVSLLEDWFEKTSILRLTDREQNLEKIVKEV